MLTKLKYASQYLDCITYRTGLSIWKGIDEEFRNKSVRNKVILRLDMIATMTNMFEPETLQQSRQYIFNIATGAYDAEKLSSLFQKLYIHDYVFHNYVTTRFYTNLENISLGDAILNDMSSAILGTLEKLRTYWTGSNTYVLCDSNGYIYISTDIGNEEIYMPCKAPIELISNGYGYTYTVKEVTYD